MREIRPVEAHEYDELGWLLVDAYDSIPGVLRDPGCNIELADVAARAKTAIVLVAVDTNGAVLGGITYCDDGRCAN